MITLQPSRSSQGALPHDINIGGERRVLSSAQLSASRVTPRHDAGTATSWYLVQPISSQSLNVRHGGAISVTATFVIPTRETLLME